MDNNKVGIEMKRHHIITIVAVILLVRTIPAHANPIVPDLFGTSGDGPLFLLVAVSALLVEYLFVRRVLHPWVKFRYVVPSFLIVNIVSFPLTTILATMLVWVAEILPLVIEPPMYKWYLRKVDVEVPSIRARIIGANLAGFALGVVAYHGIIIWKGV
ncbi:MAG: hypothetical protein ACMUIL_01000 [bacterium]